MTLVCAGAPLEDTDSMMMTIIIRRRIHNLHQLVRKSIIITITITILL